MAKCLYVQRIAEGVSEEEVKHAFSKHLQNITNVSLKKGKVLGTQYGFIRYSDNFTEDEIVQKCQFAPIQIHGQDVEVKTYDKGTPKLNEPGSESTASQSTPLPGTTFRGTVVNYVSPFGFSVRYDKDEESLKQLSEAINREAPKARKVINRNEVRYNFIYGVPSMLGPGFYRGKVISVTDDSVTCEMIDYGNLETTKVTSLVILPVRFVTAPALAHRCGLAVDTVPSQYEDKVNELFEKEVCNDSSLMFRIAKATARLPSNVWPVDIILSGAKKTMITYLEANNYIIMNAPQLKGFPTNQNRASPPRMNGPSTFAVRPSSNGDGPRPRFSGSFPPPPTAANTLVRPVRQSLPAPLPAPVRTPPVVQSAPLEETSEEGSVSFVAPNGIYVQLNKDADLLMRIMQSIETEKNLQPVKLADAKDIPVIVRYSADKTLYRGKVLPSTSAGAATSVTVAFIDYGNQENKAIWDGHIVDVFRVPPHLVQLLSSSPCAKFCDFSKLHIHNKTAFQSAVMALETESGLTISFKGDVWSDFQIDGKSWLASLRSQNILENEQASSVTSTSAVTTNVYEGSVTNVVSDSRVFVHLDDNQSTVVLRWMDTSSKSGFVKSVQIGQLFGYMSKKWDSQVRGRVMSLPDATGSVHMFNIDLGNEETVLVSKLVELPADVARVPAVGREFVLDPASWTVRPEFSESVHGMLSDLLNERIVKIRVRPGTVDVGEAIPFEDMTVYGDGEEVICESLMSMMDEYLEPVSKQTKVYSESVATHQAKEYQSPQPPDDACIPPSTGPRISLTKVNTLFERVHLCRLLFNTSEVEEEEPYLVSDIVRPLLLSSPEEVARLCSLWTNVTNGQECLHNLLISLKEEVENAVSPDEAQVADLIKARELCAKSIFEKIEALAKNDSGANILIQHMEDLQAADALVQKILALYGETEFNPNDRVEIEVDSLLSYLKLEGQSFAERQHKTKMAVEALLACHEEWRKALSSSLTETRTIRERLQDPLRISTGTVELEAEVERCLQEECNGYFEDVSHTETVVSMLNSIRLEVAAAISKVEECHAVLVGNRRSVREALHRQVTELLDEKVVERAQDLSNEMKAQSTCRKKAARDFFMAQAALMDDDKDEDELQLEKERRDSVCTTIHESLKTEWGAMAQLSSLCAKRSELTPTYKSVLPSGENVAVVFDDTIKSIELVNLQNAHYFAKFAGKNAIFRQMELSNQTPQQLAEWFVTYKELCERHVDNFIPVELFLQLRAEIQRKSKAILMVYNCPHPNLLLQGALSDPYCLLEEGRRKLPKWRDAVDRARDALVEMKRLGFGDVPFFWIVVERNSRILLAPPNVATLQPTEVVECGTLDILENLPIEEDDAVSESSEELTKEILNLSIVQEEEEDEVENEGEHSITNGDGIKTEDGDVDVENKDI